MSTTATFLCPPTPEDGALVKRFDGKMEQEKKN